MKAAPAACTAQLGSLWAPGAQSLWGPGGFRCGQEAACSVWGDAGGASGMPRAQSLRLCVCPERCVDVRTMTSTVITDGALPLAAWPPPSLSLKWEDYIQY